MTDYLTFIRLPLHLERLWQLAADRGWVKNGVRDEGFALHHAATETFGRRSLQPFRLMVSPRQAGAFLYAYSSVSPHKLHGAAVLAAPEYEALFDLPRLQHKPMVTDFAVGRRLGFEVLLRPVRRSQGSTTPVSREVDAFLHEASRRFPDWPRKEGNGESPMLQQGRSREAVYRDWMSERLAGAAAFPEDYPPQLSHFRRRKVVRKSGISEGPEAVMRGDLIVTDPRAFKALLVNGMGRHKAYGYGMLLLRPAGMPLGLQVAVPPSCGVRDPRE